MQFTVVFITMHTSTTNIVAVVVVKAELPLTITTTISTMITIKVGLVATVAVIPSIISFVTQFSSNIFLIQDFSFIVQARITFTVKVAVVGL